MATEEHHSHTSSGPTHEHSHSETRVSSGGDNNMTWIILVVVILFVLGVALFWLYGRDKDDGNNTGGTSGAPTGGTTVAPTGNPTSTYVAAIPGLAAIPAGMRPRLHRTEGSRIVPP